MKIIRKSPVLVDRVNSLFLSMADDDTSFNLKSHEVESALIVLTSVGKIGGHGFEFQRYY